MFDTVNPGSKVQVDAILSSITGNHLNIYPDEKSKPVSLHRSGVTVKYKGNENNLGAYVTLTLSERKAINSGLI
jgi:hypothetical protein